MRIRAAVSCVLVAFAMTLVACSSSTPSSSKGGKSLSVTMLSVEPSQGFDPNVAAADASRVPMAMMFETLIERNADGEWVGALAKSWKASADGLTYTFVLRDKAGFSDGSKVTADDVVFTFERLKTATTYTNLLKNMTKVTAVDDHTAEFTLAKPDRGFLDTVGRFGNSGILSRKAVEGNSKYFTKPTATSGPWQLTSYVPASEMKFEVNKNYPQLPKITSIDYKFSSDPTSDVAAVESGSADFGSVDYSAVSEVKKNNTVQVVQGKTISPTFFAWDTSKAPFNNLSVRQAVAYALDRDAVRKTCWFGTGAAAYGNVLIPGSDDYLTVEPYKTSSRSEAVDKAKQLLDQAGWKDKGGKFRVAEGVSGVKDGTQLAVTVPYESNWTAAACHTQLLQSNMADIGFKITPQAHDPASFYTEAGKNAFLMYHGGAGATSTIDLFENWFHSGGSLTALTTHLNDPAIDAQIDEAVSTPDDAKSKQLFGQLQQWQATNLPILVDGFQWSQQVVSNKIKNFIPGTATGSYALRVATGS